MRDRAIDAFQQVFAYRPSFVVRAPGRANLIGEHTDYHDGFVMPLAVNQAIWIAVAPRDDNRIRVHSLDYGQQTTDFGINQLRDPSLPHWTTYVRGAWWLLNTDCDLHPPGADIAITSDIPVGAGMSSSAAIGVASIEVALALLENHAYSQSEKAVMAVEIEQRFVGMPCGVMDQMASAAALNGSTMLLDCRSLEREAVPVPESALIVVIDSAKPHDLTQGDYATRRRESEAAAAILQVQALRDATLDDLETHRYELGDLRYRRARHVITENARTLRMKTILEHGHLKAAGDLINASHYSLRDDYEVSIAELDILTEIARLHPACYGARIMGGGFGGSAVSLVMADAAPDFQSQVGPPYTARTGLTPNFIVCKPSAGSSVEWL